MRTKRRKVSIETYVMSPLIVCNQARIEVQAPAADRADFGLRRNQHHKPLEEDMDVRTCL